MKAIELTKGQVALVDDDDFILLSQYNWYASKNKYTFYAKSDVRRSHPRRKIYMHRLILNCPPGVEVDHVDGNGLNNQKSNLRMATRSQNLSNRGLVTNNTSGYKGVVWRKDTNKWTAQLATKGRNRSLGCFPTAIDAARAYDEAAKKAFGEFAQLNFPDE